MDGAVGSGTGTCALEKVSERQIFWAVMALAVVIRFVASIPFMVGWYDEIWQYLWSRPGI
jgi:hypothetical protein